MVDFGLTAVFCSVSVMLATRSSLLFRTLLCRTIDTKKESIPIEILKNSTIVAVVFIIAYKYV